MPTRSSPTKSTPTRLTPARSTPTRSTPNKRNVTVFESMCMGCHMSQNEKIKGYLYIHYGIYKSTTGFIYPARYIYIHIYISTTGFIYPARYIYIYISTTGFIYLAQDLYIQSGIYIYHAQERYCNTSRDHTHTHAGNT